MTYVHKPIDTTECVRFTSQECAFDSSKADYFLSDSVDVADGTLAESLLLALLRLRIRPIIESFWTDSPR